jgi:hypothetical protein
MSKEINKKLKELESKSATYAVYGYERETNKVCMLRDFDNMFCIGKGKEMETFMKSLVDTLASTIKISKGISECLLVYIFMKDIPNKGFELTPFVVCVKTSEYDRILNDIQHHK